MEIVKREVECAKETVELGEGVSEFVIALKEALKDGWQFGDDLPVVVSSAMQHLIPAIQGAEKIGMEAKDIDKFINGIYVGISPVAFAFLESEDEQAK